MFSLLINFLNYLVFVWVFVGVRLGDSVERSPKQPMLGKHLRFQYQVIKDRFLPLMH